jgi:DNA-binding FadR family transcriptional regulator
MKIPKPTTPFGQRKRADEVAELIERAISVGEFKQGAPMLSEKELAAHFGVGLPSVRQALLILQQQGLVEITKGARARVTAPSGNYLSGQVAALVRRLAATERGRQDMDQTRLLYEAGVAWQAARVATDEDINRLKSALDANATALGNTGEFIRTDVAFHYELTVITRNAVFAGIHDALVAWLIDQRTMALHMADADSLSVRDHTAIFEAVAAREPMRAFNEMTSHLKLISELYRESKRLSDEIMRRVTRDVAGRIERERESMWAAKPRMEDKPAEPAERPRRKSNVSRSKSNANRKAIGT